MPQDLAAMQSFIESIAPEIRERASEIETRRGVPGDLARRLSQAGLYHLLTPASLGGPELAPADVYRALESISAIDMSVGWCCMIGSTSALGLAYLPADAARAVLPSLASIVCGVAAPTGEATLHGDHYRVSGRWQWGSSSNNAAAAFLACRIIDPSAPVPSGSDAPESARKAPPVIRVLVLRADQMQRPDTWHTMGLAGTSSGDLVVENAVVPLAWSCDPFNDAPVETGALYRMPYLSTLVLGVAAVCLGNAAAAMDDIVQLARTKTPMGMPSSLATHPFAQTRYVELRSQLLAARALFYSLIERVWHKARDLTQISPEDRAELRMAAIHATKCATAVTRGAYEIAGGTSVFRAHVLQPRLRDSQVGAQHRMVSEIVYPTIGRTLFGLGSHALLDQHRI